MMEMYRRGVSIAGKCMTEVEIEKWLRTIIYVIGWSKVTVSIHVIRK